MSTPDRHSTALPLKIFLIVSAATAMAALILAVQREPERPNPAPSVPPPRLASPAVPIAAEADVFRTAPGALALNPVAPRERSAHPRTLATFHFLRAYPGAPPRIPHALSPEEFRAGECRTCHERGGYSLRFAAYVPVTPHAELGACLQCHVGDDGVMGMSSPAADPNTRCPQCHGPSGMVRPEERLTWATSVWPPLRSAAPDSSPPPIPHDPSMRGNCLTCHGGPAAVAQVRMTHPERANCRQCHLQVDPDASDFRRPTVAPESSPRGMP